MNEERAKRKLSGILSADAVGYSRLMEEDETSTIRNLEDSKKLMSTLIEQFKGRVVDAPGDNLLAEFGSVVDATECAVEIQKELKTKNAELPDNRKMEFRIGVNVGDVVEEENRIYGDGVNIAARVESMAEAGGICITGRAYDQVKNKLELGYKYLGEHSVKNITEPVRVYKVLMEPEAVGKVIGEKRFLGRVSRRTAMAVIIGLVIAAGGLIGWNIYLHQSKRIEPASLDKMAYPLPDKPSIAVLPFDNMSADPKQGYIADGLSENIISSLSKISEMFVIARNSTFFYKGKAFKIKKIAEELGVQYILEGSVQKSGKKIRVTAQLIDAISGHHLWSEKYDKELKDLFALQDELTQKITTALQVTLTHGEQIHRWQETEDLEAWSYCVKGVSLFERFTKEDNSKSREFFEKAIKIDPNYAFAWTMLAWTYYIDARYGFSKSPMASIQKAIQIAQQALFLNDNVPEVHSLWDMIYLMQRQYEKAIASGKKAIELDPNNATSHNLLGLTMFYTGRFEQAIALLEQSVRLSPYCPSWYLSNLGMAYRHAGRYQDALKTGRILFHRSEKGEWPPINVHSNFACTYAMMGQYEKAQTHVKEVLKLNPNISLQWYRNFSFFKNPAHLEILLAALSKAGIPEQPPP